MKGIILAGGAGTRLHPATKAVSKQLLSVYDKPMIYYPLSSLMMAGVREILIITTQEHKELFQNLFGDGSHLGLSIEYKAQTAPNGIAEAFIIGREFIGNDKVMLILGDNIFFGNRFGEDLSNAVHGEGATIFCISVTEPNRYGVAVFDRDDKLLEVIEKPTNWVSNWAITGLYIFDNSVISIAESLDPSIRGELEITDVIAHYMGAGSLSVRRLGRGYAWFDAGTHDSLLDASNFVRTIECQQGLKIGSPEEIAYDKGWLSKADLISFLDRQGKSSYYSYLRNKV